MWLNKASTNAATAAKTQIIGFGDAAGGQAAVASFTSVAGTTDSATIAVNDAGKTTAYTSIAVAGIENLTVKATGTNKLGNLIAAAAETIAFTGDGSVNATLVPGTTVLKSVDASALKGGATLSLTDAQFGTNEIKVTGGAGNDSITFTDALGAKATIDLGEGKNRLEITQGTTALTAGTTIKAGSGSDTLVLNATTTGINATTGKMITGFENIVLKGASSYTAGHIAGITGYTITSVGNSNATLSNLDNGVNVNITATSTGTQTLTLADNSAATSSVGVTLNNGATAVAAAGVETKVDTNAHVLNVTSKGLVSTGLANSVTLVGDALNQVTNVVATGDQALKIVTGVATALTLVDGSAATGALTVTATGATKPMVIKGGEGNDTITASDASNAASTIIGGKGADTITLGSTAGNNAGDVVRLTGQADSTAAGFDKVTNFTAGGTNTDILDFKAFGFEGGQAAIFTQAAGKFAIGGGGGAAATFAITEAQAKDFFANAGADLGIAIATDGTDTFILIDADKNGDWNADTDAVILLVGVDGADLVAGNFLFA